MKIKRYITYFLFFISMIMLVIPVIPHHHHSNGLICMQNDIKTDCCGKTDTPVKDHCCGDSGCVTTHFFQQTPNSDDTWSQPIYPFIITLFSEIPFNLLVLPEDNEHSLNYVYLESLHSTFLTRAIGLRAPPYELA